MKKLAIMFVMLLGSVATMQAQSFDFSCATPASGDFTGAQVDILVAAGFEELSAGEFQIENSSDGDEYYVVIEADSGSYLVYDGDGALMIAAYGNTLADAIAAAISAAAAGLPAENVDNGAGNGAGTNPDADNDGFLDSEEAGRLSSYGHLPNGGFTQEGTGGYSLNGPEGYSATITVLDGVYTMTEVGGINNPYPVWPNTFDPTPLTIAQAVTNAVGYYSLHVGYED